MKSPSFEMNPYNYYALHFHMKQAGVKIVIENIMEAFNKYSKNKFSLIESGKHHNYVAPSGIKHIKIKEIDYSTECFSSKEKLEKKANKIALKIEKQLDLKKQCIIHAHNINLFKNSTLPTVLKILAQKHPKKITILVQVHDFAEDNRKDQLKLMLHCAGKRDKIIASGLAYPQGNNIFYLTINSRDKRLLRNIGISKEKIFIYPNAINIFAFKQKPLKEKRLLELIQTYADKNNYVFSQKRKILLYPVKVIKRKNIAEAILLLKIINSIKDNYQLLITLDANSEADKKYSDKIKDFVKTNKLPITIGFGYEVISPTTQRKKENGKIIEYNMADLFDKAHCILTTSTLEGFGFAFLEGWLANKAVVGRRIDFIINDFEENEIKFPGFYNKINIKGTDFGKLQIEEQLKIIKNKNPKEFLKQEEIKNTIKNILTPNTKIIKENKKNIEKNYSLKTYYTKLESLIKKTEKIKTKKFEEQEINNTYLIDYFSKDEEKKIIITDLDGTFLDHKNYSYSVAYPTYKKAQLQKIPICFCTSKSYDEQIHLRKILNNKDPFIAENGAAIYIPKNYFSFKITKKVLSGFNIKRIKKIKDYDIIELNVTHKETYTALKEIQKKLPFKIHIFTDHTDQELKKHTGLPKKLATISKIKYYADGCRIPKFTEKKLKLFKKEAKKLGFETKVGGRFVGINKGSDKGITTKILLELFRKKYKKIYSIGIGDSENDFPMLKEVDKAFLVKRIGKNIDKKAQKEVENIKILKQIGPKGWVFAINQQL